MPLLRVTHVVMPGWKTDLERCPFPVVTHLVEESLGFDGQLAISATRGYIPSL